MIVEEIKNTKDQTNELLMFGVIMSVMLGLIGGLLLWRGKDYHWAFFILSGLFLSMGLFLPMVLKPVRQSLMILSTIINRLITTVILMFLFYLVLTPIGLLMRILGKDLLNTKFTRNSPESYWSLRQTNDSQKTDYEQQF